MRAKTKTRVKKRSEEESEGDEGVLERVSEREAHAQ
jgi:hypothetical protein